MEINDEIINIPGAVHLYRECIKHGHTALATHIRIALLGAIHDEYRDSQSAGQERRSFPCTHCTQQSPGTLLHWIHECTSFDEVRSPYANILKWARQQPTITQMCGIAVNGQSQGAVEKYQTLLALISVRATSNIHNKYPPNHDDRAIGITQKTGYMGPSTQVPMGTI